MKQDKRVTRESAVAHQILEEMLPMRDKVFSTSYTVDAKIATVREYLYDLFNREGLRFQMTIDGNQLYIRSRKEAYVQRLERMIRKLAMHCGDEKLYEEALDLVGTI
jgi:hypothetical protein